MPVNPTKGLSSYPAPAAMHCPTVPQFFKPRVRVKAWKGPHSPGGFREDSPGGFGEDSPQASGRNPRRLWEGLPRRLQGGFPHFTNLDTFGPHCTALLSACISTWPFPSPSSLVFFFFPGHQSCWIRTHPKSLHLTPEGLDRQEMPGHIHKQISDQNLCLAQDANHCLQ